MRHGIPMHSFPAKQVAVPHRFRIIPAREHQLVHLLWAIVWARHSVTLPNLCVAARNNLISSRLELSLGTTSSSDSTPESIGAHRGMERHAPLRRASVRLSCRRTASSHQRRSPTAEYRTPRHPSQACMSCAPMPPERPRFVEATDPVRISTRSGIS